jgi:hypothetical protein
LIETVQEELWRAEKSPGDVLVAASAVAVKPIA